MNAEKDTQPNEEGFNKGMKIEILKSFHSQFAENQNHQQKLFIQFFTSILIVGIPFGIVLLNTSDNAELWNVQKNPDGKIFNYAVSDLIGVWLLLQIALITLVTFILMLAYSFRRDQKVVEKIRKEALGTRMYNDIFGNKSFSALKKYYGSGKTYIPLFCALFRQFAITMQWLTFFILFFKIFSISNLPNKCWVIFVILLLHGVCISISYFWTKYYFLKYRETIGEQPRLSGRINLLFYYCLGKEKDNEKYKL